MRQIALAIVILSGAIMAAAGTIAEALPDARHFNPLDTIGLFVVGIGLVLLVIDLVKVWSTFNSPVSSSNRLVSESTEVA